jgi:hypothetical protein
MRWPSDGRLTLSVPIQIKRRGGRKVVRLPDGNTLKPRPINDKPTPIQMALAADIVAAILDVTLPSEVTLIDLASGTPLLWDEQRALIWSVCRVVNPAEPDD